MKRWTWALKGEVLRSIAVGSVTRAEAMALHDLSAEELAEWERRARVGGYEALRAKFDWRKAGVVMKSALLAIGLAVALAAPAAAQWYSPPMYGWHGERHHEWGEREEERRRDEWREHRWHERREAWCWHHPGACWR